MNVVGYVVVCKFYSAIFLSTQYCVALLDWIASVMYVDHN